MKILSVQGSFTLVPGAKPLTSTYLSLVNGLNTYPGFPGTGFPVGNEGVGAEAREVAPDVPLWLRSASTRGCCCEADTVSGGGIDWPGFVTSDGVSVPTMVDGLSPLFRVA